jgi:hypothetical protein
VEVRNIFRSSLATAGKFIYLHTEIHSPYRSSYLKWKFTPYNVEVRLEVQMQTRGSSDSADATVVRYIFWSSLQTRPKFWKFALYNIEVRREVQIQGRRSSHPQKFAIILLHARNFYTAIGSSLTDIKEVHFYIRAPHTLCFSGRKSYA